MNQVIRAIRRNPKGVYTPDGWNDVFRAALANVATTDVYISALLLSIGYGMGTTDFMLNSWPTKLMTRLEAAGYPYGGDFIPTYYSRTAASPNTDQGGWGPDAAWAGSTSPPPWTFDRVVSAANPLWFSGGYGKTAVYTDANATIPHMTFVVPASYGCVEMELLYLGLTGGSFQYRVDGGALQTVTPATATPGRVTGGVLTGLNPANSHTVQIGNFTQASGIAITGIWTKKRTTGGVHFGRLGGASFELALNWGLKGTDIYPQGSRTTVPNRLVKPDDLCLQLQGYLSGTSAVTDAANANTTAFGFPAKPHLLLCECFGNDLIQRRGRDGMRITLARIGAAVRRARENASLAYVLPAVGNTSQAGVMSDPSYDSIAGVENAQNYPLYREVVTDFSQTMNGASIDLQQLWSERGVTLGYQTASDFHPTNTGADYIAQKLFDALMVTYV